MLYPFLYRRRLIPSECVSLKDDIIVSYSESIIVTKWNALKPKKDLHHGYSCYYLKEGYKISKFYRSDNTLMYWYCDIIEGNYDESVNELVVTDLLVDVVIFPDQSVRVVDLDEMVTALDEGILTQTQLKQALLSLNNLLTLIYNGGLTKLTEPMDAFSVLN